MAQPAHCSDCLHAARSGNRTYAALTLSRMSRLNKELKNSLIMTLVGALLASSGFLVKDYFESEEKQEQFVFELHKKLYDNSAIKIDAINKAYAALYEAFSKDFGLTSYELTENINAFQKAIEEYSGFIDELERYGTTGQVKVAKNYREWLYGVYAEIDLQLKSAQLVERRAKELLLIKDVESEHFKFVNEALEHEIQRLVRNENRIFYAIGWYKKPVIDGLGQYLNYQFRESIGISPTADMVEVINALPELTKKSNAFEFKEKKLPFMFAENRAMQAPTLEFEGDTSIFKQKNEFLANAVKLKFISAVIDHDQQLREMLKKRKKWPSLMHRS